MENTTLVRAYDPDKQKLAEFIIRAKGTGRTMKQFAVITGISESTLSRIANGKINNPISEELLKKIFDNRSDDADFTFESLLAANGKVDSKMVEKGKDYVERLYTFRDRGIALERRMKNTIINALLDRGFTVQNIPADMDNRKRVTPFHICAHYDFNFYLPSESLPCWYFEIIRGKGITGIGSTTFIIATQLFLIDSWAPEYFRGQKTSFVFEDRFIYEQFIERFKGAPITNAFSAILVNAGTETVVEETWISSGDEIPSVLSLPVQSTHDEAATWKDEEYDAEDFE